MAVTSSFFHAVDLRRNARLAAYWLSVTLLLSAQDGALQQSALALQMAFIMASAGFIFLLGRAVQTLPAKPALRRTTFELSAVLAAVVLLRQALL